MTETTTQNIRELREYLATAGYDGFLLPVTDEYQGEYSADYARRVTWLSGFDGSAGMIVVLPEQAVLLVDGRYTLQAAQEVNTNLFDIHNSADVTTAQYLSAHTKASTTIAYDPWLHTVHQIQTLSQQAPCTLTPLNSNPVDALWHDQPPRPMEPLIRHDDSLAGCTSTEKITQVTARMAADALLLTEPDTICWLLNIRGSDIPYNPLPLCYAVLHKNGQVELLIHPEKVPDDLLDTQVMPVDDRRIDDWMRACTLSQMQIDPARCPIWFAQAFKQAGVEVVEAENPITLLKAIKNVVEIDGMRAAHHVDGTAFKAFTDWFDGLSDDTDITELDVIETLEAFRRRHPDYIQPSFATIAGAAEHGAIVHYRASEATDREIAAGESLLIDSGGQYAYGTTDITRCFVRGEPSAAYRRHYTLVLKGHIALATAIFPEGTTGHQLDALARQFLWAEGLDYQHGTGHGVGHFLCVHEGPQSISTRANGVALMPGMICSNEPGYYAEGKYGIRIESLVLVVEKMVVDGTRFFGFETLTRVPIDTRLADRSLMSGTEWAWLEEYNQSSN